MYKIILIISVSTLLSFKVSGTSNVPVVLSDTDNEAKTLYDQLWQVANDGLNEAIADYKSFFDQLYTASVTTRADGLSKISDKSDGYNLLLSSIKNSANSAGLNITSCLQSEVYIIQLEEINSQDLISCVNSLYGYFTTDLIGEINGLMTGTWNQVYAEATLDFCGTKDDDCITNRIEEIKSSIPAVASQIKSSIDNESEAVELLISDVESCLHTSMVKLDAMGGSTIDYIKSCVDALI